MSQIVHYIIANETVLTEQYTTEALVRGLGGKTPP